MPHEPSSEPRPHVLQVGPLYVNHVRRWSERAAALGWRVSVAGHVREGRGPVEMGGVADRVEVAPAGLWEKGMDERSSWLEGVIADLRPDLVQAHWLPTWCFLAGEAGAAPLIATPWGSDVYLAAGENRERADAALLAADAVIARSPHMRREILERGVPAGRVHDVDLGVDVERLRPASPAERARLQEELELGDGPIVLSIRAGTSLYNLDVVLEAFSALRFRFGGATLVLLTGGAPLADDLRESLIGLGGEERVLTLAVPHDRVADYMRAATVGVSIPDSDGSPSSVWEAMACGLPLVLSDLAQVRERVGDDTGVRFVEPAAGPVSDALAAVLEDPADAERMGDRAREWAMDNADRRDQVERLGALYDGLLRRPAGRSGPTPGASPPSSLS